MFKWLQEIMISNAVGKLREAERKKQPKKSLWQKIKDNKDYVRRGGK